MRIVAEEECREWLQSHLAIGPAQSDVDQAYPKCARFQIPSDAGRKTALARVLSRTIHAAQGGLLWITAWGVFPSSENMALFDGYRKSLQEVRPLWEAPGHVFSAPDLPALECLLALALYFHWDAGLFVADGGVVVRISHDEWMSLRAKDDTHLKSLQGSLDDLQLQQFRRTQQ